MGPSPSKVKFKNSTRKPMEGTDRGQEASPPSWNRLWRLESETWPGPWDRTRVPCKVDSYPLYQQGRPRPSFESAVKDSLYEMRCIISSPSLQESRRLFRGHILTPSPPTVPTAPSPPRHPFLFAQLPPPVFTFPSRFSPPHRP